jgi:hypothetical protein
MITRILAGRATIGIAALLTVAAAPPRYTPVAFGNLTLPAATPTATQAPPAADAAGFTPAPVPNIDLQFGVRAEPATVSLAPTVFHQAPTYLGEGYTPNSTLPGTEATTKRIGPVGGLNLSVPLQ